MALDLLAISAHRDDSEITCGGLLIRMARKGYKVGCCDLTQGELGTRGSADARAAEAAEASRIMGLAVRVNCRIPDGAVFNTRENQERIVEVLREHRPRVVVFPGPQQRHPDHRVTPQVGFDAAFFSGLARFGRGEKYRPHKILYTHLHMLEERRPTFVVDVTDQMDDKVAAVLAYRTQFPEREVWEEKLRAIARSYGLLIGRKYGEGYLQRETMEVDDVVALPVASL